LIERVDAVPLTDDPGEDLVSAAVAGYRVFTLEHPDLFRIFFTASFPGVSFDSPAERASSSALSRLVGRVERARAAGLLGDRSTPDVTLQWDALCAGMASRELCGMLSSAEGERIWTDTLRALLAGMGTIAPHGAAS
jgi:hypothetical protein